MNKKENFCILVIALTKTTKFISIWFHTATQIMNQDGVACLEVSHTCRADSGEYTCTARNKHGRASTTCDLRVKGEEDHKPTPPTFTTSLRGNVLQHIAEYVLKIFTAPLDNS